MTASDFRVGRDWEKEEYICEIAGVGGNKNMCFANSSYYAQLNKLLASLVSDEKHSVRKPWVYFLPL